MDITTLIAARKKAASSSAITSSVESWLERHPEVTTTVQDGSISKQKLDNTLKGKIDDIDDLKDSVNAIGNAVENLESGSLTALNAINGQVPTADGEGSWEWATPSGGGGTVTDVQVNGVSVLSQGVANVPMAGTTSPGVVKYSNSSAVVLDGNNNLKLNTANSSTIKAGTNAVVPSAVANQHEASFYGLAKAAGDSTQSASSNTVGTYTETAKSAISQMLNGSVAVSGTTPSITALPGIRYVCGEVATLDITIPASGIVDVVFESGSTPTVLTATGVTWPAWFDATALEANTTYEISIADGYGAVMTWA